MRFIFLSLFLLPLGLFSQGANAWNCTTITPNTTISPANITIPRDLPVGAQIGTQIVTPTINAYHCYNDSQGIINNQKFGVQAYGTYASMINGRRVYKTNIAGVGYAIGGVASSCSGSGWVSGSNTMYNRVDTYALCSNDSGMVADTMTGQVIITYYKTAQQTDSGTVQAGKVAALVLLSNDYLWYPAPEAVVNVNAFTITTPACKVEIPTIPVNMQEVARNAFNGKGSWPGDAKTQSFNVPLSCSAGARVSITMEGNVFDATKGVINTTTGNGAASGVGIQLLYNNAPTPLNTPVSVGTSETTGSFDIPLKARYYQTGDQITAGTANGMATFTLKYD